MRLVEGFVDLALVVWLKCFQHLSGGVIDRLNAHDSTPIENKIFTRTLLYLIASRTRMLVLLLSLPLHRVLLRKYKHFSRRKCVTDTNERQTNNWWAEGDTPVRANARVTYLVDGRTTMLTMCRHFLRARKYIYLANWGITPTMRLVRGTDQRAGPDGSPEQEALLAELRAEGLQQ